MSRTPTGLTYLQKFRMPLSQQSSTAIPTKTTESSTESPRKPATVSPKAGRAPNARPISAVDSPPRSKAAVGSVPRARSRRRSRV